MNGIVKEQKIFLNEHYDSVKSIIQHNDDFIHLSNICRFRDDQKSLIFKTEKIHPETIGEKTISILLLFSNPHPLSVKAGLFLSEPRSRSFWQRIFECNHITATEEIDCAVKNWMDKTPDLLSECLLSCSYDSRFRLFFDCLESLPTNQYGDLKKIFKGKRGRELRETMLQRPGRNNLFEVSMRNNITAWVLFSVEAYRCIIGEKDIAKYAPRTISLAINRYLVDGDSPQFWDSLKDLKREIQYNSRTITVYLALIARYKNWKAENGEYYFTIMINQILDSISAGTDE
ncbi:MAG: hypothetical protein DDT30_02005 [Dehalococcoidia bacterium]|nr:hypothetical protein [Bacillota bacterium]